MTACFHRIAALTFALATVGLGCSGGDSDTSCDPGSKSACECSDGAKGSASCSVDGKAGACVCGAASASGATSGSGGAGAMSGGHTTSGSGGSGGSAAPTYYADVKPIFDASCVRCHAPNGFAPIALGHFSEARLAAATIKQMVVTKQMPPWMPDDACRGYENRLSIAQDQIDTIAAWVDAGAAEGDAPPGGDEQTSMAAPALSRIDVTLEMPEPFKQVSTPDDLRCFVLDWPKETAGYITGFGAQPGNEQTVHHISAFVVGPDDDKKALAADAADPKPGFECFNGPPGTDYEIGSWSPGVPGYEYPHESGFAIAPGSKIVIQMHYNSDVYAPAYDQSKVFFRFDDNVKRVLHYKHMHDKAWNRNLDIPAYAPDTGVTATFDTGDDAELVYMTNTHMHWLGAHSKLTVTHPDGTKECLLDVPQWNFHWQQAYILSDATLLEPHSHIEVECHWDNSPEHQRQIEGGQLALPTETHWGPGAADEMCFGGIYTVSP